MRVSCDIKHTVYIVLIKYIIWIFQPRKHKFSVTTKIIFIKIYLWEASHFRHQINHKDLNNKLKKKYNRIYDTLRITLETREAKKHSWNFIKKYPANFSTWKWRLDDKSKRNKQNKNSVKGIYKNIKEGWIRLHHIQNKLKTQSAQNKTDKLRKN
jgi:hypothetical protein